MDTFHQHKLIARKLYLTLFELSQREPDTTTWATLVENLLERCGFGNYWVTQQVGNEPYFLENSSSEYMIYIFKLG